MTQMDALTTAADTENTAIFVYGLATAFVGGDDRIAIGEYIAAHRVRRDAVNAAIVAAGGSERTPAAGYTLPADVTDGPSAAKALLLAENTCASAYRALVEQADDPTVRRLGVDGLTDCALRIAHWRASTGLTPTTVPFPGA
ncbi:hypothetical protein nbrc107696_29490 [Gordonia spumicola]|uniref:DUF4439 domain-containing protein n=1 Tax=Gordonia spumicola TaxID=589161 RepID=A0A7I9VBL2_9ACTN|nr:ferritin-like domain-containing protein [Gordonia spumicola]GEE02503.1 hypothetical protein nbrc107696_29490 [Gordonia spumicola]